MTTATLMGQMVKTGRTGKKPQVLAVIWSGTAEVLSFGSARVPAALVRTDRGDMAIARLAGCDQERDAWWDARCLSSREYETAAGDLIGDADPAIAALIDDFLASKTDRHEESRRSLHSRITQGTYAIA